MLASLVSLFAPARRSMGRSPVEVLRLEGRSPEELAHLAREAESRPFAFDLTEVEVLEAGTLAVIVRALRSRRQERVRVIVRAASHPHTLIVILGMELLLDLHVVGSGIDSQAAQSRPEDSQDALLRRAA